jgi:hypothetical protein
MTEDFVNGYKQILLEFWDKLENKYEMSLGSQEAGVG